MIIFFVPLGCSPDISPQSAYPADLSFIKTGTGFATKLQFEGGSGLLFPFFFLLNRVKVSTDGGSYDLLNLKVDAILSLKNRKNFEY
jgi:hypothetical protein